MGNADAMGHDLGSSEGKRGMGVEVSGDVLELGGVQHWGVFW